LPANSTSRANVAAMRSMVILRRVGGIAPS